MQNFVAKLCKLSEDKADRFHCSYVGSFSNVFVGSFVQMFSSSASSTGCVQRLLSSCSLIYTNGTFAFCFKASSLTAFISHISENSIVILMLSGIQIRGAASFSSMLQGETAFYKSSRAENSEDMGLTNSSKVLHDKNNSLHVLSHAGPLLSSRATNLVKSVQGHNGTLSEDNSWKTTSTHILPSKSRHPEDGSWKHDTTKGWQTQPSDKQNYTKRSKTQLKSRIGDPQSVMNSIASLSIGVTRKSEQVPKGSINFEASMYLPPPDRGYLKHTPSVYSVFYKRKHDQTPMEKATYREYLPFFKSEFKAGMIIRMNIHESDFMGPPKAHIVQASQVSTLAERGTIGGRRRQHRHHGDFGSIYSENRICIVVNVADDIYTAIPLFTHHGKGLAHKIDKNSWVSVEDHRQIGTCIQQTSHQPLRTAFLSPECNMLNPVSAAWIPYAFPCRYDIPVAYQGKLDGSSARRLVRLHRKTWIDEASDED